jgi:hypothetical protein
MDYIVDWARDIFRPSIMRQLMSVVDKGEQSSYTIVDQPEILSTHDLANSRYGGRPVPTIAGAGTFVAPAESAFDAVKSTTSSSFEPLFESTGEHVDIKVWESAKYESRVRGLFVTEDDTAAMNHLICTGYQRLITAHVDRCWFLLSSIQDIKIIEEAWTGNQEIKDVRNLREQKILISLYVQYRKDGSGAPVRELTYFAVTETVAWRGRLFFQHLLQTSVLVDSAYELELKLQEAWTSSNQNYYKRYANGQTSVLCVTASDHDRSVDRVNLGFYSDGETTNYAKRLDAFIKTTCENQRGQLYKLYSSCYRYTNVVHSLTMEPHCVFDPTQDCVFINTSVMRSGICIYVTNAASEKLSHSLLIRLLLRMVVVYWDSKELDSDSDVSFCKGDESYVDGKTLLWIASDPQWDLYTTMKSTLTTPGMRRVHKHLAWMRKVLLRHKCGTGIYGSRYGQNIVGSEVYRRGHRNIQHEIQLACKKCDYKDRYDKAASGPTFCFCDEDFMPDKRF